MDCAKAVGARVVRPKMALSKMAGLIKVCKKLPTFIAIPTTAGTGSETTVAAVIVDSKTHHKYVINDFCLIPEYALLDPAVTVGLPKHLTATTGMDALTHAVEAYIGKARTKDTKIAAEKAVKLIFDNLELAYENGNISALGFTTLPSATNFVFTKHPAIGGEQLYLALKERAILVRHFNADRISDFCRITVGTKQQVDALLDAIRSII